MAQQLPDPASISAGLIASLKKLEGMRDGESSAVESLYKKISSYNKEAEKAGRQTIDLSKGLGEAGRKSIEYQVSIQETSKQLQLVTDFQKKAKLAELDRINALRDAAMASGNTRDASIFSAKSQQMQSEIFRDNLKGKIAEAQAAQASGDMATKIKGHISAMAYAGQEKAADMAVKVGGFLGQSAAGMEAFAGVAGPALGIFAILQMMLEHVTAAGNSAVKTGFDLGSSLGDAGSRAVAFDGVINRELSPSLDFSREKIMQFSESLYQNMGLSIDSNIEHAVSFAHGLAAVGTAFGIGADEGVKLGSELGVLSRGSIKDTRVAFEYLGETAYGLHVSMGALAQPMLALAAMGGAAGRGMGESLGAFDQIISVTDNLSNMRGPFDAIFSSMRDADKTKAIQNFVQNFSKISDIQFAAFAAKPGQSIGDLLGQVSTAGPKQRLEMIQSLYQKAGIADIHDKVMQEYTMGVIASGGALRDQIGAARTFGRQLIDARSQGKPLDMSEARASALDEQFAKRQTVGQYLASGGDAMTYMANLLYKILGFMENLDKNVAMGVKGAAAMAAAKSTYGTQYGPRSRGNAGVLSGAKPV